MSAAAGLARLARHELRLGWREWAAMMTAGRRYRGIVVAIIVVSFVGVMHLVAGAVLTGAASRARVPDTALLAAVSGAALLYFALILSQAMESVTRVFYARADLDLILSSPIPASLVLAVRVAAVALATALMAMALASPFINVMAWQDGARWLAVYGAAAALGAAAAAAATLLTDLLYRLLGPRRTRIGAQIVAAVVGAGFAIGIQAAVILNYGAPMRPAALLTPELVAGLPGAASAAWWPARGILGEALPLAGLAGASLAALAAAIALVAPRFAERAAAAAGLPTARAKSRAARRRFRGGGPAAALRRKERTLLVRDPWLLSQTLTQLLYLLPPALLLWRSFGTTSGGAVIVVPVLVMAAGQLAGGLAWLAVSGEDAPELVASAPVSRRLVLRAKIEAALGAVALVFALPVLALAWTAPAAALVAGAGIAASAGSAIAIQLRFRAQARRSHFRRRQTSSRIATFAEAFGSIFWASAAGLAAAGSGLAVAGAVLALIVLGAAWLISPRPES